MERFSTDDIPQRDRLAVLNEVVARHVAGRRFMPADGTDIRVEIAALGLPGQVTVATSSYSPVIGARTGDLLNDGRDSYLLTVHAHDHEVSVDGGKPITVPAGNLMLISDAMRSQFQLPDMVVKVVSLERKRLSALVPRIDVSAFHHVPAAAAGMPLMTGYADLLRENPSQGEKARDVAASHLYDLVALVLDGFVEGGAARNGDGIRAARLDLVKRDVLRHLQDPDVGIHSVARRQGITPRYIQALFEAEGTTFSDFLRDSRLDLAFRLLGDTISREVGISAIAYDCGFSDLSNLQPQFSSPLRNDALRGQG